MSYCVNCGVELADNLKRCPLCDTEVLHPGKTDDIRDKPPYPGHTPHEQTIQRNGIIFILSLLLLIPATLVLVCDLGINHAVTWSGYAVGACAATYLIVIPPIRFPRMTPVGMLALDTAGICAYLYLIERMSGGAWFLPFGLPVSLGAAVIVLAVLFLLLHTRAPRLNIVAGALAAVGLYAVWIEFLVNKAFHIRKTFIWSLYPLATFLILGAVLVVIEYNKPLKERLRRKFFI